MQTVLTSSDQDSSFNAEDCNESIFNMLFKEDEISWQKIIYELVKTEQMNPWDVDISNLSQKYLEMLKKLQGMDFRISGKVILAAAILLKIKSDKLVGNDLFELTRLMNPMDDFEDDDYFDDEDSFTDHFSEMPDDLTTAEPEIVPRTPQPRDRKVSVYDLINALDKALNVKKRRTLRQKTLSQPVSLKKPEKSVNITVVIQDVYERLKAHFNGTDNNSVAFSEIVPNEGSKQDKVYTFVPLLHLRNQKKVALYQEEHLGEIDVMLYETKKELAKQLKKPKKAPKSRHFKTKDGKTLTDIEELAIYLDSVNLRVFKTHVNKKKNDFASWVDDALKDKKLAEQMHSTTDYHETVSLVIDKL